MENIIKVYRWEKGEILEKAVNKSDLKLMTGWRTEPDEAMLAQLKIKRCTLETLTYDIKQRIDELIALEKSLSDLGIKSELPKENPYGLSLNSIKESIGLLTLLLERNNGI